MVEADPEEYYVAESKYDEVYQRCGEEGVNEEAYVDIRVRLFEQYIITFLVTHFEKREQQNPANHLQASLCIGFFHLDEPLK